MKIVTTRQIFTKNSSIGTLTVDGKFICHTLEPTDRGLDDSFTPAINLANKIFGKTAIPVGVYPLLLINGAGIFNRFHFLADKYTITDEPNKIPFYVPAVQNVKAFEGVLIHPGNYPKDTEGCTLVGLSVAGTDFIGNTPAAFDLLRTTCFDTIKSGGVTYEIQREPNAWAAFKALQNIVI